MTTHTASSQTIASRGRVWRRGLKIVAVAGCAVAFGCTPAFARAALPSFAKSALADTGGASASVSLASPYGESHRFGGYDPTGSVLGKFVHPVGFAVDSHDTSTSDGNAIYVLDETIADPEEGQLQYRLQKLSSSGAVLGSVELPLQSYGESGEGAHPMVALSVDSSKHRVYAIVESIIESGEGDYVPVASELVAWSTIPNSSKELVRAPGYSEDPITHASLVAGSSVLQPEELSKDLYAPTGLTVASNHDVVIEAQDGVTGGTEGGPTILQRVATEGSKSGQLDGSWIATGGEAPDGVFTSGSGAFGVDLYQGHRLVSKLEEVKANFEKPETTPIAPDESGGIDLDQAPSIDNSYTVSFRRGPSAGRIDLGALLPYTAASPVTQLSNGLYAARYAQAFPGIDPQSEVTPWGGVPRLWVQEAARSETADMGIRLFTSSGAVATTIGGQPEGDACNLNYAPLAVAAGSKESVFVLTQPNERNGDSNDEVIEFTPGGKGACPQPAGTMTVDGKSGSSVTVPAGESISFADTVERKGGAPYRFDWVLLNAKTLEVEDLYNQIEGPEYLWPAPSKSHTFAKEGTYYLAATMYGDYGVNQVGEVVEIKVN
jgi:hypothetical protein